MYSLLEPDDPQLNLRSQAVVDGEFDSKELKSLIESMLSIAKGEQGDKEKKTLVGLAAPQIGSLKRVVIVATNSTGMGEIPELEVFINPEITKKSEDTENGREGCYSTGSVCGVVNRPSSVTVKYRDINGDDIESVYQGFVARIFQHEIDHLDGIRFPDHIKNGKDLHWVEPEEFGRYREEWATWDRGCSREKWELLKIGRTR